jgi:DNA-binding PadR family transcriptional regulator
MNEDMPWVNLTQEEVDELREKKYELSEYGKEKIKRMMENTKLSSVQVLKSQEGIGVGSTESMEPEWRSITLWSIMREELGFSIDMCDEIVDAVEGWLPKEHDTNSYKWNECLKKIKGRLR